MKKLMMLLCGLSVLVVSGLVQAEGSVARAIVATGVVDREPMNDLERILAGNEKVFFFTELRGMEGKTIKHRWSYGGELLAEVEFNVGGPRWRIWSSKKMLPEWAGDWELAVVDSDGSILSEKSFSYAGDGGRVNRAEDEDSDAEAPVTEALESK